MNGPQKFDRVVQAAIGIPVVYTFLAMCLQHVDKFKDPLIAAVSVVIGYWLGSSLGSKRKEEAKDETNAGT